MRVRARRAAARLAAILATMAILSTMAILLAHYGYGYSGAPLLGERFEEELQEAVAVHARPAVDVDADVRCRCRCGCGCAHLHSKDSYGSASTW